MNLAFAVMFLWLAATFLYLGSHGLQAGSPWAAWKSVLGAVTSAA